METIFEPPKPQATEPTVTDVPQAVPTTTPAPHPLLTLDVKALGAALEQLIRKTLAFAESQPRTSLSVADLSQLVLFHLKERYSQRKISAPEIRQLLNNICKERADLVGHAIYPAHLVRLSTTNFFILRSDAHRPEEFRGLPDVNGILNAP